MEQAVEQRVWERARHCCEYCQFPAECAETPFQIDHIVAEKHGGTTVPENLALSCFYCNSAKRNVTDIPDPCSQAFGEHLEVLDDGRVRGLTVIGRDLVQICQLDRPRLIEFRRRMLTLSRVLGNRQVAEAVELRRKYFGKSATQLQRRQRRVGAPGNEGRRGCRPQPQPHLPK